MALAAAAFTLLVAVGGAYETVAIKTKWVPSITELTRQHPHAAILFFTGLGIAFGYALGVGGS